MLRQLHPINGYKLAAKDGEFGRVKDFLFDEEHWTIRYMVADTGRWIPDRKVLISPVAMGQPDWDSHTFGVELTREQIGKQPGLDTDAPVSRQYEQKWHETYGYPYYYTMGSAFPWGYGVAPTALFEARRKDVDFGKAGTPDGDQYLRSFEEIRNYQVDTADGETAYVEDLVIDDETWTIRYMIINSHKWVRGRSIILAPSWLGSFDWASERISCGLSWELLTSSPNFDSSLRITRDYEKQIHDLYEQPVYWSD